MKVTKVCNIDFGGSGGGQRKLSFARRGVYKMGVFLVKWVIAVEDGDATKCMGIMSATFV